MNNNTLLIIDPHDRSFGYSLSIPVESFKALGFRKRWFTVDPEQRSTENDNPSNASRKGNW